MALTLTSGITADADEFVVTGAVPANVGPGFRFRIDDELLRLQGFGPHTEIVGAYARQWAGKDPQRWLVERGVEHSTPASHAQGADVLAANDAYVSSDDLTPPSPFTGGEGGSGLPAGGDVGDVVTNTAPGEGEWAPWHDGLYVQPTDPGAVGAGKLWIDTTDPAVFAISRRGPDDDVWYDVLSYYEADAEIEIRTGPGSPLRLRQRDGDGNVRSEIIFDQSQGRTDINVYDAIGSLIATWEVGEDGFGGTVYDELLNARALHSAEAGASDVEDAFWEWTVKNTAGAEKAKLTLNETGVHGVSGASGSNTGASVTVAAATVDGGGKVEIVAGGTGTYPDPGSGAYLGLFGAEAGEAGTAQFAGGNGAAGEAGGGFSMSGGSGDEGNDIGAQVLVQGGDGEGGSGLVRLRSNNVLFNVKQAAHVALAGVTASDPPTQNEVQAVADAVDAVITALIEGGWMAAS